jgi:hypothetical protein
MQENVISIGADSETKRGVPISFQFYSDDMPLEEIVWIPSGKKATALFLDFLDRLPNTRDRHFVLWGHNLSFDVVSFFYDRHSLLRDETVEIEVNGWKIRIIYAALVFAEFRKGRKHITMIDTGAYFLTKLANLAEMVCPDLPKLEPPKGLGQRRFSKRDKKFCAYAMRDSVIAYRVGIEIIKMHRELDIPICVSAPHFASRVFRRKFMKTPIPLPPRKIVYSSLSSYHGGKNNITVPMGIYKNVYALDIRSAYPFAMSLFPSFTNPDLYRVIEGSRTPPALPPFGVYKITGHAAACDWPIIYDHSFKPVVDRDFDNLWVTGFELNEALRRKEVTLTHTFGYIYRADLDKEPSPFATYVNYFFEQKENIDRLKAAGKPFSKVHREFYKLLLNSLYGKFIQTMRGANVVDLVFDLDENKLIEDVALIAAGLFNPFVATLITGHTRAYIHRLEHEYQALHTSTDGVFTQIKPVESPGLGGLSVEAFGDLLLFRNKLYIFYSPITVADEKDPKLIRSTIFPGKKIVKYALHGFHGTLQTLEKLYDSGTREYEYTKVNKLRESLRRNLAVNDFVQREATLKL